MKIIFLDIDGVLNNTDALEAERCSMGEGMWRGELTCEASGFDPENVKQLKRVLEIVPAHIVISSSWRRLHTLDQLRTVFENWGISRDRILGATPQTRSGHRGKEISLWIKMFTRNGRKIKNWAIVDDDTDFLPEQPLFRTSFQKGLTENIANDLIEWLI